MAWHRWLPTFLAFPLAGLVSIETVGSFDDPLSGAAGGLLAGAIIGSGQWLALRSRGVSGRWVPYTAAAMAAGMALAGTVTGAGTELTDVVVTGLIAGTAVGAAQSTLLVGGPRTSAIWTAITAAGWSLGWLATSATIVDIERGYHVFGSSGALVATVLTGLALRRILAAPATTRAASATVLGA